MALQHSSAFTPHLAPLTFHPPTHTLEPSISMSLCAAPDLHAPPLPLCATDPQTWDHANLRETQMAVLDSYSNKEGHDRIGKLVPRDDSV